ncbi:MAG TPA: FAD-dependent oxidoreductase, partial [Rubrobacter sp.]|nr:FAD-dependent oxidoreductase [Rubrobacter sp.]
MAAQHYDAVVIGAGQAGVPLSQALAGSGRSTALIEREHVGGTCINVGCTPTKTMVASAKTAYIDRRSAEYGVHNGPVSVDMRQVRGRKRAMVDGFRASNLRRIEAAEGLDLISGEASFTGPRTLAVRTNDGEALEIGADNIFINVGCTPTKTMVASAKTAY